jgi:hypothetical protein
MVGSNCQCIFCHQFILIRNYDRTIVTATIHTKSTIEDMIEQMR